MGRFRGFLQLLSPLALILLGLILACIAGEALVRVGTLSQKNYVIEMWRYATLLKRPSADPAVGHEHVPMRSARLQGVEVSINSLGMRGPEARLDDPTRQKIVILGDSLALGWGVPERETLRGQLEKRLGNGTEVLNAGVGNMNMFQIVAHWLHYSGTLQADTVIVLASPRAAEVQHAEPASWLLRHSELWALVVSFLQSYQAGGAGRHGLIDAYRQEWTGGEGIASLRQALDILLADQKRRGYKVIVVQLPETHDFDPYSFGFMTEIMQKEAGARGWEFVDPLPALRVNPARSYWVSDDDIHLNGEGFSKVADTLIPLLKH